MACKKKCCEDDGWDLEEDPKRMRFDVSTRDSSAVVQSTVCMLPESCPVISGPVRAGALKCVGHTNVLEIDCTCDRNEAGCEHAIWEMRVTRSRLLNGSRTRFTLRVPEKLTHVKDSEVGQLFFKLDARDRIDKPCDIAAVMPSVYEDTAAGLQRSVSKALFNTVMCANERTDIEKGLLCTFPYSECNGTHMSIIDRTSLYSGYVFYKKVHTLRDVDTLISNLSKFCCYFKIVSYRPFQLSSVLSSFWYLAIVVYFAEPISCSYALSVCKFTGFRSISPYNYYIHALCNPHDYKASVFGKCEDFGDFDTSLCYDDAAVKCIWLHNDED